jgi:dTDP-4-dehydrorhamnose 3,5-epimerase
MYNILSKDFDGYSVVYFQSPLFTDNRGYFTIGFNNNAFEKEIVSNKTFVQQNISYSTKNVARGLHYQMINPQGKLVSCINGNVIDIVFDIRPQSKTYGKLLMYDLSSPNTFLYIPEGFAHGFITMSETATFQYFVTDIYNPDSERGINLIDTLFNVISNYEIKTFNPLGCESYYNIFFKKNYKDKLILSEKDKRFNNWR